MATAKLTSKVEQTVIHANDLLYVVDSSDTTDGATGTGKKMKRSNLILGLAASGINADITSLSALSTSLSVTQGGTGASTLTGILKGTGTAAITAITAPVGPLVGTTDTQTLTNKTLTSPIISTISNTGTLTLPTASDTLVGRATTDTLTNKTLTSPVISTISNTGTLTLPTSSDTLVGRATTDTLTNKRITARTASTASSATPTPNADITDIYELTALAAGATFGAPTGTPTDGQKLIVRIKDNASAQTLSFNALYRFSTNIPAPTTTVISKTMYLGFLYNSADTKWDCLCVLNNY